MVTCFGYQIPTKTAKSSRLFVPHQLHHQSTFILWCLFHNTNGVLSELQWDTYRSWPSTSMQGCSEMFLCTEMHKIKSALSLLLQSVYRVSLSLSLLLFSYYSNFISLCLSLTLFLGLVSLRLHSFSTASATAASCVYEGSLLLVAGTLLLLTAQQQLPWQLTCCSIWHFLYLFLASLSLSLLAFSATFSALLSH